MATSCGFESHRPHQPDFVWEIDVRGPCKIRQPKERPRHVFPKRRFRHPLASVGPLTWINMAYRPSARSSADFEDAPEEVPMRTLALTVLTVGIALATGQVRAQTYDPGFPVCMHVAAERGGYQDCTYYTMAQCAASASGRAAQCNLNPYYAGAMASMRRSDRHYRQVGSTSPALAETVPDSYCLQGRAWGYPGNCQFYSYAQCMVTASGTGAGCGINPHYAFALQRRGAYRVY
jgi:Protein of unknown function (DUF3551)